MSITRARLVDDISFDLYTGQMLGLVGSPEKAMTARSIVGLLPSSARIADGSISLHGEELVGKQKSGMTAIRGWRIGYVPQDPFLSLKPVYQRKRG